MTEYADEIIANNLISIKKLISSYEEKYHRNAGSVQLLLASKGRSLAAIKAAIKAKQYCFGENTVQESLPKIEALSETELKKLGAPFLEWHFIGSIQSNKTHKIAEHFSWVHSVSQRKIAERLNDHRPKLLPPLNICIEVNVSYEQTKTGIELEEVASLAELCLSLPRLRLRGLMAIPAPDLSFEQQRQTFHQLFLLWQSLRARGIALDTLSMGMSDDFEAAIAEGATIVRIGSAVFGPR